MLALAAFAMALNFALVAVAAFGLAALTRPQTVAGWLVAFLLSAFAIVIVISELAGRISYDGPAMLAAAGLAALLGAVGVYAERERCAALPQWVRAELRSPGRWTLVFLAFWGVMGLYALAVQIMTVPVLTDSLRYHLAAPGHWHDFGRIAEIQGADYRVNHFPHGAGLLYGWSIAVAGTDMFGGLFAALSAFVLWPAAIFMTARRLGAEVEASIILSICGAMTPIVVLQGSNEGQDVMFWSGALIALYVALLARNGFGRDWLILGLAAGLALATKSFGLVIAASVFSIWLGRRLLNAPRDPAGTLLCIIGAGLTTLLIGGWVYGYNLIAFGNPVYPYDFFIDFQAGARPDEAFQRKSVLQGEAGPLVALSRVLALTPALLLSLEPLDRIRSANISGFGVLAPTLVVSLIGLALFWLLQGRQAARERWRALTLWAVVFGVLFLINGVIASQWGAQIINKPTPDYSSIGRYQLWWMAAMATMAALLIPPEGRARSALYAALLTACLFMTGLLLADAQRFGLAQFRAVANYFPDRFTQSAAANGNLNYQMHFLVEDPRAPVLELDESGRVYPLMRPLFERPVYSGALGAPNANILFNYSFSRTYYDYLITTPRPRQPARCIRRLRRDTPFLAGRDIQEIAAHLFNDQIVSEYDVRYVMVHNSLDAIFFDDPRYELMLNIDRNLPLVIFKRRDDFEPIYPSLDRCLANSDAP